METLNSFLNRTHMPQKKNIFRPAYRQLEATEQQLLDDIKTKAKELLDLYPQLDGKGAGREISIAMTKLEESVMWAVKGITK